MNLHVVCHFFELSNHCTGSDVDCALIHFRVIFILPDALLCHLADQLFDLFRTPLCVILEFGNPDLSDFCLEQEQLGVLRSPSAVSSLSVRRMSSLNCSEVRSELREQPIDKLHCLIEM